MILQKTKQTFTDKDGKVVNYEPFCVKGIINDIPFTIILKPFDNSQVVKDILSKNVNKADVQIKLISNQYGTYENVVVSIEGLDSDIKFKVNESDKVLIKLYNKVSKK